jgi:uncharacterized membrane protein YqaE (UPF0057 family)
VRRPCCLDKSTFTGWEADLSCSFHSFLSCFFPLGPSSAIPIKEKTGFYGWSFWVSVVLCAMSFAINIAYVIWQNTVLPPKFRLGGASEAALKKTGGRIEWKTLWFLPWAFWFLPVTQLFQSGAVR